MSPEPALRSEASSASAYRVRSAGRSGAWVIAAWVLLCAAFFAIAWQRRVPALPAHLLLLLAPLAASLACARAARAAAPSLQASWWHFASGAGLIAVRQVVALLGHPGPGAPPALLAGMLFVMVLAAHLALAAGAALAIPALRSRSLAVGLLADLLLVLIAGGLFALKLAVEHSGHGVSAGPLLQTMALHLAAALSMLLLGLLLVWRDPALHIAPVAGLVVSGVFFALGNAAGSLVLRGASMGVGTTMDLVWLTGWAGLLFAGVTAWPLAGSWAVARPGRVASVVGGFLIPAAALYMGALGLDYLLRPYVGADISIAMWFLAAPLALRAGQALRSEARRREQGQELVNTRALVELNRALAGALELAPTLELVTRWASRLTGARGAAILLLSADEARLEVSAATGLPHGTVGIVLPVEPTLAGSVVRQRRSRRVEEWSRAAQAHADEVALFGAGYGAAAPLLFRERALGVLVVVGRRSAFDGGGLDMLSSLADSAAVAIENARLFEEVKALTLLDPLTGLANRRALERDLAREFAAARRGRPLTAVLLDIDGFKRFNDTLGHIAGDEALRTLGAVLQQEGRAMNLAARYGGDEFVALMSDTDPEGARVFAERSREAFRQAMAGYDPPLDLSYGVATYDEAMATPAALIVAADRALYQAKRRPGERGQPAGASAASAVSG